MRQIKFRVWNKKTNNWVECCGPSELNSLDGVNLFGETILLGGFMDGVSIEDLNECVALQFTGLKDKNDKDIFEGDIVRICNTNSVTGEDLSWNGEIYFDKSFAQFRIKSKTSSYSLSSSQIFGEIIGNLFKNPELLK